MRVRIALSVSILIHTVACSQVQRTYNTNPFGSLADLTQSQVFLNKGLTEPIANAPSHGLVVSETTPYRLVLIDGRVAWSKSIYSAAPLTATFDSDKPAFSTLPLAQQGETEFAWLEARDTIYEVIAATEARFEETPTHIKQQGRQLFNQRQNTSHFWPQLQLTSGRETGWASITDVTFEIANDAEIAMHGLIQKPFLSIEKDFSAELSGGKLNYLDITSIEPEWRPLPDMTWHTHQLVVPKPEDEENVKQVALMASGPCHMFFVAWHSGEKDQFGYCKDGSTAPSPLILDYFPSHGQNGISLRVLEVSGDDDRTIMIKLPSRPDIPLKLRIQ